MGAHHRLPTSPGGHADTSWRVTVVVVAVVLATAGGCAGPAIRSQSPELEALAL